MSRGARIRAAVLVPPLVLALGACGSAATPATGTTAAPAASSAATSAAAPRGEWTTVATFSGNGGPGENTAPFTLHGGSVQVIYTVQPNDSGPVPFLSTMFHKGDPYDPAHELGRNSCASCDGKQSNDLGKVPAGDYYLHVITSRPWNLVVQERG
jgi:hypothetical protein